MMSDQLTYGQYSTSVAQPQIKLGDFWLFLHTPALTAWLSVLASVVM